MVGTGPHVGVSRPPGRVPGDVVDDDSRRRGVAHVDDDVVAGSRALVVDDEVGEQRAESEDVLREGDGAQQHVGAQVEGEQLWRAETREGAQRVREAAVQHPQTVAAVDAHSVHGDEPRAVGLLRRRRRRRPQVPVPAGVRLRRQKQPRDVTESRAPPPPRLSA